MRRTHTSLLRGAATLAAAGLLAAGCSSSKSSTSGGTPSASATATTGTAPAATGGSSAAGGQPSDPAAAKTAVTQTYTTYFDSSIDQSTKGDLIQNPQKMQALVTALASATQGKKSSIKVNGVTFTSPTTATVDFAILLDTATVLPSATGQAVLDPATGKWQVADTTLCSLATLDGVPATVLSGAGCS
jgi:hypothetical protein